MASGKWYSWQSILVLKPAHLPFNSKSQAHNIIFYVLPLKISKVFKKTLSFKFLMFMQATTLARAITCCLLSPEVQNCSLSAPDH